MLIFCIVLSVVSVILAIVSIRFIKRTMQFDEIFTLLFTDIEEFIASFDRFGKADMLYNSPEVRELISNTKLMRNKLSVYASSMKDVSTQISSSIRSHREKNRPIVVD